MLAENSLEDLEIRLLLQAIHAKYGYHFVDYAQSSMRRRGRAALTRSGLPHLGELQHKILLDPNFFASVLDDLTVRVSDVFRDPPFFRMFRERVVPTLRTYPLLKVWHAGCASGEEVYATAILLAEENLYERAQIYATDMSQKAVELARAGVYSSSATTSRATARVAWVGTSRRPMGGWPCVRRCDATWSSFNMISLPIMHWAKCTWCFVAMS
jgi:chemotaxis protein methyltransferase CheR